MDSLTAAAAKREEMVHAGTHAKCILRTYAFSRATKRHGHGRALRMQSGIRIDTTTVALLPLVHEMGRL